MTKRQTISLYISAVLISIVMLFGNATSAHAQLKMFRLEKDSIPLFQGFSVSFDLVGAAMLTFGDNGQYEGALRVNLHDQWFPVLELGIGRANREKDEVTELTYKTSAPFFRIGMDWNILKNKHQANRMYAGFRYAFTSYKVDIIRENLPDPVWKSQTQFGIHDYPCNMHWLEAVIGIDAKIFGPLHLGWSVRYKRRIAHKEGDFGNTWYVPGFGTNDKDGLAANFNIIFDI